MGPKELVEFLGREQGSAILRCDHRETAYQAMEAAAKGGFRVLEFTLTVPGAFELIEEFAQRDGLVVGAGTVLTPAQVDAAVDAGARFIVSPGTSARVLARCAERGVPALPGVATATDIMAALDHGAEIVKFFPAEAAGGLPVLKALAAPFGQVRFVPTGGITPGNLASYLAHPKVVACGGTWMVKTDVIDRGAFDEVEAAVREAVKLAAG